jgi:hypothetical protein
MAQAPPLTWTLDVSDLSENGQKLRFEANADQRARLGVHAGIQSIESLSAIGDARRAADGVEVRLVLTASYHQACVVSLVPVAGAMTEDLTRIYLPPRRIEASGPTLVFDPIETEPPEPLVSHVIDLGPVVAEHFILGLDPYPRAPGAELPAEAQGDAAEPSPFAVLRRLKDPG